MGESCLISQMSRRCLGHSQLPTGALNHLKLRNGFEKLKSVAEGISLPGKSMNLDVARGQRELQSDDLSDPYFIAEHGGDSRLADIHRVSAHHGGIAQIDANIDFQPETRMTAGFSHC